MRIARIAQTGLALALIMAAAPSLAAQDDEDAVAVRFVRALSDAWANHDGNAWGALFWPDAEFVNVFGGIMTGQAEITATHERLLKGPLRDRKLDMKLRKVRLLSPTVIVMDTHDTDSSKSSNVETRLKLILEKRGSVWKIIAAQNTQISEQKF
jgi:uncharacterized protein (TIGR02246 family)